jgi:predicted component of viral defense system (DUF524 family)
MLTPKRLLTLMLLLFVKISVAQQCRIKGTVTDDSTKQKLDSVKIEIYEDELLYKIIFTDTAGRYDTGAFQLFKKLNFLVSRKGYGFYKILFNNLKENSITFINLGLDKLALEEIKKLQEESKQNIINSRKHKRKVYKIKRV